MLKMRWLGENMEISVNGILVLIFLGICGLQDVRRHRISRWLLLSGGILAAALQIGPGSLEWWDFWGGVLPGIFLLLVSFVTREALGYGDGFAVMAAGMFLGLRVTLEVLLLAFLMTAVVSGVLLAVKKVRRNYELPFLPFLWAAAVLCLIFL